MARQNRAPLDMGSSKITSVADPSSAQDAATKAYVDVTRIVAQGGTGRTTLTTHSVLVGAGTSQLTQLGVGTDGQVLLGQSSADPAFTTLSGDVSSVSSAGLVTIAAGAVTLAKQANLAANTIIGNNTGSAATPLALTRPQVLSMLSAQATSAFDWGGQDLTNVGAITAGATAFGTKTASFDLFDYANATTITMNADAITLTGLKIAPVATWTTAANILSNAWNGIQVSPTLQGGTGSTGLMAGGYNSYVSSPTIKTQDSNAQTNILHIGFKSSPTFVVATSGSMTVLSVTDFGASGASTVPANATVSTWTNFLAGSPPATGTITTWIGLDVPAVTAGGTNIGIRNKAQTQLGSTGQCTVSTAGNIATSGTLQVTGHVTLEGVTSTGATGTGKLVFDTSPTFAGDITLSTHNLVTDTTTGTQIATGTTQKLGFWGATPVAAKTGWGTPTGTLVRTALANPTYTTTGATGVTAGAFDTAAHRDNIITDLFTLNKTVQALITDLKSMGIIQT